MKTAKRIEAITITGEFSFENEMGITTDCIDYDEYHNLPQVVEYRGRVFGKTGWNSDLNLAYFRTDARVAFTKK